VTNRQEVSQDQEPALVSSQFEDYEPSKDDYLTNTYHTSSKYQRYSLSHRSPFPSTRVEDQRSQNVEFLYHHHSKSRKSHSSRKHSHRSKSCEELATPVLQDQPVQPPRSMIESCPTTPDKEFSELNINEPRKASPLPQSNVEPTESYYHPRSSEVPDSPISEPISPPPLSPSTETQSFSVPSSGVSEFGILPRTATGISVSSSNWSGVTFNNPFPFAINLEKDDFGYSSDTSSRRNSLYSVGNFSDPTIPRIGTPPSNRGNQVRRGSRWHRVRIELSRLRQIHIPPMPETITEGSPGAEDESINPRLPGVLGTEISNTHFARQQTFPLRSRLASEGIEVARGLGAASYCISASAPDQSKFSASPKVKLEQFSDVDMEASPDNAEPSLSEEGMLSPDFTRDTSLKCVPGKLPSRVSPDNVSDRSLSNAGTSECAPSECSECDLTQSIGELSGNDDSGLLALYIEMLQKVIIEKLTNLINNESDQIDSLGEESSTDNSGNIYVPANEEHSSHARQPSSKRPQQKRGRQRDDEDEDDDYSNRNKFPKTSETARSAIVAMKLACPYYKRYPETFEPNSTCASSGWDTVHRVKYVHYRKFPLAFRALHRT
jgi:hypothetical protein